MAKLLVRELLRRCSSTLSDTKPQFGRHSEIDMVLAARNGVRALCKYMPHVCARTDAVKLDPGTQQRIDLVPAARVKPGDGSDARDMWCVQLLDIPRNRGSDGVAVGRAITLVDRQRLDTFEPDWHASTGPAVLHYAYNPQQPRYAYVYPGVMGDVWVDMTWAVLPPTIVAGGEPGAEIYKWDGGNDADVGLDELYSDELWNYIVAYRLLSDKGQASLARAMVHAQAFTGAINTTMEQLTGQNPNLKTLPFAPEVPGGAS
ncbi:MAG: DUF6682 family protein [Aquabacterium sp.]|uniref:phage adaptor protein n=1 Tax=Aquabacterium sp. TaxID=1872578 RepID=UPI003BB0106C